jgi:hypothetical protein
MNQQIHHFDPRKNRIPEERSSLIKSEEDEVRNCTMTQQISTAL